MLDGTHYLECECGASEHTLRFIVDYDEYAGLSESERDPCIFTEIYLNPERPWWQRLKLAVRYVLGMQPTTYHFDCWRLNPGDAKYLRDTLHEFILRTGPQALDIEGMRLPKED